jgi:hypothetical protein
MLSDRRRRNKGGRFQERTYWTAGWLIARQPCRSRSPAFLCFPSGIADCRMWGKERRNGKAIMFSRRGCLSRHLRAVKEAESSTFSPAFTVSVTSDQMTFIPKGLRDRANHSKGRFVNSLILFCPFAMRDLSIRHRDHPEVLSLLRIVSALLFARQGTYIQKLRPRSGIEA